MRYTYFAASLPSLVFGAPPPMPLEGFLAACRRMLTAEDMAALDALLEGRPSRSPFVRTWQARDTQLRNATARARAAQLGVEVHAHQRDHAGWDVALERAALDAMGRAHPLEREMELDRVRWRIAEDLSRFRPFGPEAIWAYALKLRIAARWAALDAGEGRRRLDERVESAAATAER